MSPSTSHLEMPTSTNQTLSLLHRLSTFFNNLPPLFYSLPILIIYLLSLISDLVLTIVSLNSLSVCSRFSHRSVGRFRGAQHLASFDPSRVHLTSSLLSILPIYCYFSTSSLPYYYQVQPFSHSIYACYLGTYHLPWPTQSFQSLLLQLHYLY